MKDYIPYGKHFIDQDDVNAVVDILENHNLTQGNAVKRFEDAVAQYVGAKYAVAMSSWTAGLHMACIAADINENNKVLTSPLTFIASSNAALYCNSKPIFADIERDTLNINPKEIKRILTKDSSIKAIIPVHFAGLACNMEKIYAHAKENNVTIIEDAAHALGAKYDDGSMVGSCKYSDMTGFSFHPVKSIAAGEGGMITTNDPEIYSKLLRLRSHGINKLDDKFINTEMAYTNEKINPWYYEMQELGYNYRITDIQCALGTSQLKKLPNFLKKRFELANIYDEVFSNMENLEIVHAPFRQISSHHLYILRINFEAFGISRSELMYKLREENILTQVHYMPVTSHPFYKQLGYKTSEFKEAEKYYEEALSIPLYYSLSKNEQKKVISCLTKLLS